MENAIPIEAAASSPNIELTFHQTRRNSSTSRRTDRNREKKKRDAFPYDRWVCISIVLRAECYKYLGWDERRDSLSLCLGLNNNLAIYLMLLNIDPFDDGNDDNRRQPSEL